jgi:hypothetical protein
MYLPFVEEKWKYVQINKLQHAAQLRFDSILDSIKAGYNQQQSSTASLGEDTALQQQLESSIVALQHGLVERDTEVRLLPLSVFVSFLAAMHPTACNYLLGMVCRSVCCCWLPWQGSTFFISGLLALLKAN